MIDTGSDVECLPLACLPHFWISQVRPTKTIIKSANNECLDTLGVLSLNLSCNNKEFRPIV